MPPVVFISTLEDLASMLAALQDLPTSPPSLYIDLEGAKLSRNGTIALLTLYMPLKGTVYLIDIHTLGARAFSTPATTTAAAPEDLGKDIGDPATTLKTLLESTTVPKVFFDVRNDSDALFSHYGINLSCIHDLQLMELATTTRVSRDYLVGLAKTIEYNASRLFITPTQAQFSKATKEAGLKLFAPEHGGSYRVFEERPLSEAIKNYCVQDVVYMPKLWSMYNGKMAEGGFWQIMALEGAARRVDESHLVGYQPNGTHKRFGCWTTAQIRRGQRKDLCG
jgi:exonuclease 3'-5' domain-containing protein 1